MYGVGDVERALCVAAKDYVLGVASSHWFGSWDRPTLLGCTAADIAKDIPPADWQRLSAGDGTKGSRLYDWCYLELATLDA